jgi:hypothetical protein
MMGNDGEALGDSEPYEGDNPVGCRASGKTRRNGEVCRSALYSSFCEEGPLGTGPLGLCIMVANRTREIRPSGITTGAWGIVRKGSRIEAQREIAGSATVPCRRMRLRSIQTLRGPLGAIPGATLKNGREGRRTCTDISQASPAIVATSSVCSCRCSVSRTWNRYRGRRRSPCPS